MRNNVARDIIRQRRARNMILPYMEHIHKIIKVQSQVRVFLAKKKLIRVRLEENNLDREVASLIIQRNIRSYLFQKNNRLAYVITRFVRNIPTLRARKLERIRNNLRRITVENSIRQWIRSYRYMELPNFQTNLDQPAELRIQTYLDDRTARLRARQHNRDVLNRRLINIRRNIDNIIIPYQHNRVLTERQTVRLPARQPARLPERLPERQPLRQPENRLPIIMNPTRIPIANRVPNNRQTPTPEAVVQDRPRHRTIHIRTQQTPEPIIQRHNHRALPNVLPNTPPIVRPNGLPNTPPIVRPNGLPNTPPIVRPNIRPNVRPNAQHGNIRNRLLEIEEQFRDPRIRAIYQNNRVIMPDGNRVLPNPGGGVRLEPNANHVETPLVPGSPAFSPRHARDCLICFDSKADFRMINPGCDHLICFKCTQSMINSALGNITTAIPIKCPINNDGCDNLITPYTDGVKSLLLNKDFEKFEKFHILKLYVPNNRLRYCPNSNCGMPFEINDNIIDEIVTPPHEINFRLYTSCLECETLICIYCNDYAHPSISCREFQQKQKESSEATSEYIKNYCKQCPICKVNVQKQQTPAQEQHEKTTGMAGGTSECHHVTCGACKGDFCWTCLKTYSEAIYYHRTCPNNDCSITFHNGIPRITHLPIGQYTHIKLVIYNGKNIDQQRVYQINNSHAVLGARPEQYNVKNKTVVLHCNKDGIVKRLEGLLGDYSFTQNNKAIL